MHFIYLCLFSWNSTNNFWIHSHSDEYDICFAAGNVLSTADMFTVSFFTDTDKLQIQFSYQILNMASSLCTLAGSLLRSVKWFELKGGSFCYAYKVHGWIRLLVEFQQISPNKRNSKRKKKPKVNSTQLREMFKWESTTSIWWINNIAFGRCWNPHNMWNKQH